MTKSDSTDAQTAALLSEIADLEAQLASLKASMPAHSLSPAMFEELEDLEEKIKQKRAALPRDSSQSESQADG